MLRQSTLVTRFIYRLAAGWRQQRSLGLTNLFFLTSSYFVVLFVVELRCRPVSATLALSPVQEMRLSRKLIYSILSASPLSWFQITAETVRRGLFRI